MLGLSRGVVVGLNGRREKEKQWKERRGKGSGGDGERGKKGWRSNEKLRQCLMRCFTTTENKDTIQK